MIIPPGWSGVAFGTATEGDARRDPVALAAFRAEGVPDRLAFATQVHGATVAEVLAPGNVGEADSLFTTSRGLTLCVATADCVPVAIGGEGFAAIVHAGWRGLAAGVVSATVERLRHRGLDPVRAAIGPAIGPCCYEVGPDVLDRLGRFAAETTSGTPSLDLRAAVRDQLGDLEVWSSDRCTLTDPELVSYRRNRTTHRQVALTWLPTV